MTRHAAGVVFLLDGVLIGAGDARYLAWAGIATTGVFAALALPVASARRRNECAIHYTPLC